MLSCRHSCELSWASCLGVRPTAAEVAAVPRMSEALLQVAYSQAWSARYLLQLCLAEAVFQVAIAQTPDCALHAGIRVPLPHRHHPEQSSTPRKCLLTCCSC
jgi:hypothetical protein